MSVALLNPSPPTSLGLHILFQFFPQKSFLAMLSYLISSVILVGNLRVTLYNSTTKLIEVLPSMRNWNDSDFLLEMEHRTCGVIWKTNPTPSIKHVNPQNGNNSTRRFNWSNNNAFPRPPAKRTNWESERRGYSSFPHWIETSTPAKDKISRQKRWPPKLRTKKHKIPFAHYIIPL